MRQYCCEGEPLSLEPEWRRQEEECFKPPSEGVAGDSEGSAAGAWSLREANSLCNSGHIACALWTPVVPFSREGVGLLTSTAPYPTCGSRSPWVLNSGVKSQREAVMLCTRARGPLPLTTPLLLGVGRIPLLDLSLMSATLAFLPKGS